MRATRAALGTIVRISERTVAVGMDAKIRDAMVAVKRVVLQQPGLVSLDTVVADDDPSVHCLITEWESKRHLNNWLKSETHKRESEKLDKLIGAQQTKYRTYREAEDDIFLL